MELKTLDDVLETELKDLYSAEKQLVEALPDIAQAASSKDLTQAISEHLEETRGHVKRLEEVFEAIGIEPESEHCDGMEGLISEGSEVALTAKEFLLLEYLMRHCGRVVSRERLLTDVWGYRYAGGTRTVDVHVRRLRKKLPALTDAIATIHQFGYKLVEASEIEPALHKPAV